ncbi:MAG: hypothetical protein K2I10_00670 [Lachnospiraceae bacterium]|nr:hypothetical protein [Lachnospiraceae bacterium]
MGYKNGKEILPVELIRQIQQYVDGENIYIPKKEETRICWGQNTDTRKLLHRRNTEIYQKYLKGDRVADLSEEYHISTQGIYKILSKQKGK